MKKVEESSPFDAVNLLLHPEGEQSDPHTVQPPPAKTEAPTVKTEVNAYPMIKIYNMQEHLLYVCCTLQLQSLAKYDWFQQKLIMNVTWWPTAGRAMDAKAVCIDAESPLHNKRRF